MKITSIVILPKGYSPPDVVVIPPDEPPPSMGIFLVDSSGNGHDLLVDDNANVESVPGIFTANNAIRTLDSNNIVDNYVFNGSALGGDFQITFLFTPGVDPTSFYLEMFSPTGSRIRFEFNNDVGTDLFTATLTRTPGGSGTAVSYSSDGTDHAITDPTMLSVSYEKDDGGASVVRMGFNGGLFMGGADAIGPDFDDDIITISIGSSENTVLDEILIWDGAYYIAGLNAVTLSGYFNSDDYANWASYSQAFIPVAYYKLDDALTEVIDNPPIFTAFNPPDADDGTGYSYTFVASGSPTPTYSIVSGALPTGLSLDSSGHLTGTPTVDGTYSFTVRATNSSGHVDVTVNVVISASGGGIAPTFTSFAPQDAHDSVAYSYTFVASGSPTITYSVVSGSLPTGLSLNSSGHLTGTPTVDGTYSFTVRATNVSGTADAAVDIVISAPVVIINPCVGLPSASGSSAAVTGPTDHARPASSYSGTTRTLTQKFQLLWNAGFRTASDLQIGAAIAMAESSSDIGVRNWHPGFGFRTENITSMTFLITVPAGAKWTDGGGVTHVMRSDRGMWQISDHFYPQYTDAMCDNPQTAACIVRAIKLLHDPNGWTQWDTYNDGSYSGLVDLADAQAFVDAQ